jgi:hypothetical protein
MSLRQAQRPVTELVEVTVSESSDIIILQPAISVLLRETHEKSIFSYPDGYFNCL